jgi:hypothetical protein
MNVRYRVELSQGEREALRGLLSGGKHAARKLKRAQILLAADAGASDAEIATSVAVGGSTVYRTKRRFVLGNLEAALSEEGQFQGHDTQLPSLVCPRDDAHRPPRARSSSGMGDGGLFLPLDVRKRPPISYCAMIEPR